MERWRKPESYDYGALFSDDLHGEFYDPVQSDDFGESFWGRDRDSFWGELV
jgi:hypothetical protein